MGRDGLGRAEIAAELDICFKTLYNWEAAYPEFLQATTRARQLAQGWWEAQGRKGIWSRDFNAAAYRLQVMNRFRDDWHDKQSLEHTGKDGGPIDMRELSDEELRERTKQITNRLAALVGKN